MLAAPGWLNNLEHGYVQNAEHKCVPVISFSPLLMLGPEVQLSRSQDLWSYLGVRKKGFWITRTGYSFLGGILVSSKGGGRVVR